MPTYVTLLNWTDQGVRAYEDTVQRSHQASAAMERLGVRMVSIYWTIGPYDLVAVVEAPDDETATAALLQVGSTGNVRTTSMRAFGAEEVERIVAMAKG